MELTETIETLNTRLKEHFGVDTISGMAIWRIVWSEDQFENRYGTYDDITPGGIYIRTVTEVRRVPKYRQWIQEKYVLERLVVVPEVNEKELPDTKLSYEPLWVFEDRHGKYLPPKWEPAKIIIDTVYAAQYSDHSLARYKDPESNSEEAKELHRKNIDNMVNELFGDELGDQGLDVMVGQGIHVPSNYKRSTES